MARAGGPEDLTQPVRQGVEADQFIIAPAFANHGEPVAVDEHFRYQQPAVVRFAGTGAFYNDAERNFGAMALLQVADSGVRLIVGSHRAQAGTQAIFRHFDFVPDEIGIIGLKSSVHFLADFAALTSEIVYAAFPGLNTADPEQFPYRDI